MVNGPEPDKIKRSKPIASKRALDKLSPTNSVLERPSAPTGFGKSTKAMAIVGPHRSRPAYPKGLSSKQLANESSYFFFFDLHMVVGHMPLRTLQGEKSPIILRS